MDSCKVYVIRRPLKPLSGTKEASLLAHSAILFKDSSNTYWIIEYMDDSCVHSRVVKVQSPSCTEFNDGLYQWSKQEKGVVIKETTKDKIHDDMTIVIKCKKYQGLTHNCHVAQEVTRYMNGWAKLSDLSYSKIVNSLITFI